MTPFPTTKKEGIILLNASSNLITTRTTYLAYQTSKTIVPQTTLPTLSLKPSASSSSSWTTARMLDTYSLSSEKVTTLSNIETTNIQSKNIDHLFKVRHRHR